jgi:hypothetical protein
MKSYWQESIDKKQCPKLDKDTLTDVCIIGGGMVRNSYSIYARKSSDLV